MTVQLQLLRAGVGPMLSCSTVAEWRRNRPQCSWCQSSRGPTWQRMESISAISSKGSVWAWTTRCYRWNMLTYGTQHSLRALTAKVRGTILSRNGRPNWLWDSRWQLLSMQIFIDRKFTSTTQWSSCLRYIATSRIHVYARTCITVQHSPVQSSTAQHSPVQRRAQHTAHSTVQSGIYIHTKYAFSLKLSFVHLLFGKHRVSSLCAGTSPLLTLGLC